VGVFIGSPRRQTPQFFLHAEQLDEFAKHMIAQLMESLDVIRGFAVDPAGIDGPAEGGDFLLILGHPQPAMDHPFVDFEMELKAIDGGAVAKSLIGTNPGKGQVNRATGDIEGIAMPLKNLFRALKLGQQRIPFSLRCGADVIPADFFFTVGVDIRSERSGDQLRAEADAQHRQIPAHRFFDQFQLGAQMRELIGVVDPHRTAQNHQAVVTVETRLSIGMAREIHVANSKSGAFQQRIQRAENFMGHVLQDKKLFHNRLRSLPAAEPT
jgi:hypothetical protein